MGRWIGAIGAAVWLVDGIIIIGSMLLEPQSWMPNTVVGFFFIAIGAFWGFRSRNVNLMLSEVPSTKQVRQFVRFEMALDLQTLVVAVVALSAVVSRVFGEGKAVFG